MNRVAGKVALVTGGARGLGRSIAAALAREGARVYVSDVNAVDLARVATEAGAVAAFEHDVTSVDRWREVTDRIAGDAGRLDILVNNAGIARTPGANTVESVSLDSWRSVVAVNCEGTLLGCQNALRVMKQAGGGSIVNISSIAGLMPTPTIAAYGFSKAGVRHLTVSVAQYGAPFKIRCNSVHPGMIRTAMLQELQRYHGTHTGGLSPSDPDPFLAAIPMGEYQTEEDVALGVLFLASDEARFITGAQLVIDGGMMIN